MKLHFKIDRDRKSSNKSKLLLVSCIFLLVLVVANIFAPVKTKTVDCRALYEDRYSIIFGQKGEYDAAGNDVGNRIFPDVVGYCSEGKLKLYVL